MTFDLKKTKIYKAVSFSKLLIFGSLRTWRNVFLTIGIFSLVISIFSYMLPQLGPVALLNYAPPLLGLACIFVALGFSFLFFEIFYGLYLKYPRIEDNENVAEFLDFDSAMVMDETLTASRLMKEESVSTNALLMALASYEPAVTIFTRIGIDQGQLRTELEKSFNLNWSLRGFSFFGGMPNLSADMADLLNDVSGLRQSHASERLTMLDLLTSLFDHNAIFQKIMIDRGLDKNDLSSLAIWYESNVKYLEDRKRFWTLENLLRQPPIGVGWIYGYPWFLSHYAADVTRQFQEKHLEVKLIGRQKIVDQMEQTLSRAGENNILLVGEPGVGKRTVIMGFTQMIAEGKALSALNYKRVFELNVPLITSSSKDVSEIQGMLISLLNEAVKAGNIILIIEDLHNFIGALGGMGRVDISQMLLPYLESNEFQVIATTDPVSFHKYIENRAEITKVFEKIDVSESSEPDTLAIIEELVPTLEDKNKILLGYDAIKTVIESSDKYIHTVPFPEKAIDLLTETVSHATSQGKRLITSQDVYDVITLKTQIPLGNIGTDEKEKLTNLESEMHRDIIGQDEAVKAITDTMQRLRAGLTKRGKPAGVFLFVGPTGVGKTQTAKILAKTYFGSKDKMIRFDMSEYQDPESLDRFLGSLRINEPGQLASAVRDNPFSVILLDELEKADKNILNIFLAVFDEGQMTDVFGRKVNFEQNIIIATSNAAADMIRDMVNQGLDPSTQKEKVIDQMVSGHYFSPEFLNRFDEIVIFHPLTQEQLYQVAELLISALVERLRAEGYLFKPTTEVIDYISKVGFDPQFGARPMQRAVQDKLESVIARKILEATVSKGTEFGLTLDEIK
jgi:ATP-dependent Clp protease ATP-binding subunit ClpC